MTADLLQRLVRVPPWTESVRTIQKIRFENRFQNQQRGHLRHPVSDRRYPQRPQLPIRLRDVHPPHRLRPIALGAKILAQLLQELRRATLLRFYLLEGDSVHSRRSAIVPHSRHRRFQHIAPIDPVVQRVKPELRFLLGLVAQLLSQQREFLRQRVATLPVFRSVRFRQAALLSSDSASVL